MGEKKWYKTWWGILAIILLLPIFVMVFLSKLIWKQNWKTQYRVAGIAALWGIVIVLGSLSNTSKTTQSQVVATAPTAILPSPTATPTTAPKPEYEIKKYEVKAQVENFEVLIKPGTDGKSVALYVQKTCKKPCNIYIYDNEKALNLQLQYDQMDIEERNIWRKQNYVYVADHLVGSILFELPDNYDEYPFRDWQYRELGGTH